MVDASKIIGGTFEDINEAVVKPVADEVGRALEQGGQAIKGQTNQPQSGSQNPQQVQQTKQDEQQKIYAWRWRLDQIKKLDQEQKKVREDQKQKLSQQSQVDSEEKKIKQFEIVKKQEKNIALERAKVKTEIKGSIGG